MTRFWRGQGLNLRVQRELFRCNLRHFLDVRSLLLVRLMLLVATQGVHDRHTVVSLTDDAVGQPLLLLGAHNDAALGVLLPIAD